MLEVELNADAPFAYAGLSAEPGLMIRNAAVDPVPTVEPKNKLSSPPITVFELVLPVLY